MIDNRSTVDGSWDAISRRLPGGAKGDEALALVIAWSREEPERAGEIAFLDGEQLLGRGGARPEDTISRVRLHRQRPGGLSPAGPIGSVRISRAQLKLTVAGDRVRVESLGRCPLFLNGRREASGDIGPGDTILLQDELLFLVVRRPRSLPPLRAFPGGDFPFGAADAHGFVGESPPVWALRDQLAFAARSPGHVLVHGESGVGKELGARAIHALSSRAGKPLVARNAATFPEGLVDAELFGAAKNYPNPGTPEREGVIGEADGSTLFLDEIGELPSHLQAHLLRVLDRQGEYQRLGESRVRRADLRVVAATNRSAGELKHDLLARLTLRIELPPLGDRREDIPLLIRKLLAEAAAANPHVNEAFGGAPGEALRVDPRLYDALIRHTYRTHLRELEQLLWQALAESHGSRVELTDGVRARLEAAVEVVSGPAKAEPTREEIVAALGKHGGSVTRAAKELGLKNRFVLYRIMKKVGIGGEGSVTATGEDEEGP